MIKKISLISALVLTTTTVSTVLAQNVQLNKESQSETLSTSSNQNLRGLRERTTLKGTSSTGGGGARVIPTESYPDKEKLQSALKIIEDSVERSDLPRAFKAAIIAEVLDLKSNDNIRVLPALVDFQRIVKGRNQPGLSKHFISLSGISTKAPSEEIILSAFEHQKKNNKEAASSILHEVLHNIVSEALTDDEKFLDDLESAIMDGKVTRHLQFAIKEGLYLAHEKLVLKQLFNFLGVEKIVEEAIFNLVTNQYFRPQFIIKGSPFDIRFQAARAKILAELDRKFDEQDLTNQSMWTLIRMVSDTAQAEKFWYDSGEQMINQMRFYKQFIIQFKKRILEVNPSAENSEGFNDKNFYKIGCVEEKINIFFVECNRWISLRDYLTTKEH